MDPRLIEGIIEKSTSQYWSSFHSLFLEINMGLKQGLKIGSVCAKPASEAS